MSWEECELRLYTFFRFVYTASCTFVHEHLPLPASPPQIPPSLLCFGRWGGGSPFLKSHCVIHKSMAYLFIRCDVFVFVIRSLSLSHTHTHTHSLSLSLSLSGSQFKCIPRFRPPLTHLSRSHMYISLLTWYFLLSFFFFLSQLP